MKISNQDHDVSEYGIGKHRGPFGTVYSCPRCEHHIMVQPGTMIEVGADNGHQWGRDKMRAHVCTEHPWWAAGQRSLNRKKDWG